MAPAEPKDSEPAELRGVHYRARVAEGARTIDVTLCFDGTPSGMLVPGTPDAIAYLENPRVAEGPPLPLHERGVLLDPVDDGCMAYTIDLEAMARAERSTRRIRWVGDSVLVQPSAWLWRPERLHRNVELTLSFELPDDTVASVPWPRERDGYRLDATAFRWLSWSIFGSAPVQRFHAAGAEVELVVLDAPIAATPEGLRAWATDAAQSVALLYGTFPRDHLQIVVVPVTGGGGTIYFGAAGRGGGSGVYILMDASARDDQLLGGWTTAHELLHHGLPFVGDAWMSEGWVSYYTEVVRTRMGHRSEREGWSKLREAFERGQRDWRGVTLASLSERMHQTRAYHGVYWGGAAVAFLLDVALREDSAGAVSLDDAMRELRRCCGDARVKWSASDLLEHLDAWYGKPIFTTTAREHLERSTFPPVEQAFTRLGVRFDDGDVIIDESHPASASRRSIMAPLRSP
mgnify:CR=1 FL=1